MWCLQQNEKKGTKTKVCNARVDRPNEIITVNLKEYDSYNGKRRYMLCIVEWLLLILYKKSQRTFSLHLNAMHEAREVLIKAELSLALKKSLKSKILKKGIGLTIKMMTVNQRVSCGRDHPK